MKNFDAMESAILEKEILPGIAIESLDDYVAREWAAGIREGYAVVTATDDNVYVLFDRGEVQNEDGEIVEGAKNPFATAFQSGERL